MKLNHIICPTDFSECSVNALRYAASLAKASNAHLHLVHVYNRPYSTTSYNGSISAQVDSGAHAEMREAVLHDLRQLAHLDFMAGVQATAKLITDKPAWKFYEDLDTAQADLVVMGTLGMTGLLHGGIIGTNTERVIRHAPMPVLSVPGEAMMGSGIKRILFATDFTEESTSVFSQVADLARILSAKVEVAYINTADTYAPTKTLNPRFDMLKRIFPDVDISFTIYNEETVTEGLRDLTVQHDIDLVAMMTHGRTGLSHFVRGSIAEDVSATVKTPLLALKKSF